MPGKYTKVGRDIDIRRWHDECQRIAREIVQHDAERGMRATNWSKTESLVEIHARGKRGEIAVCLLLGLDPYRYTLKSDRPDGGVDVVLPRGHTMQIKTTGDRGHRWFWHTDKDRHAICRFNVLVWPGLDSERMTVVGWLWDYEHELFRRPTRLPGTVPGTDEIPWQMFRSWDRFPQYLTGVEVQL